MANITIGDEAIPFTLPGVDGRLHSLVDYGDRKALAVIFIANHCPYVQAWEDRLIALQAEFAGQGVQFLAIGSNDANQQPGDGFEAMRERAEEKGYTFPYLHDSKQEVATAYGATHTPEVFLFSPGDILRYHGAVDDNHADPDQVQFHYLRDAIAAVLANERPPVEETELVGCTIKWLPAEAEQ